ncbi:hypothetical protein AC578_5767 [Pseudocercospora eumusae]|uniref:NadR/Ttd14 AAA domain-containing protein n=1 Tax=Pseudocercospora eumusae TaxID=321146 RepID=A0A139H5G5_9PEZI|nr:hypothetical protein AC578_5767 [Pseudocercospora eumusae]
MEPQQQSNIYIVGPSCTGKTTLLNALKEYFDQQSLSFGGTPPAIIAETAREVLKKLDFKQGEYFHNPKKVLTLQQAILKAQYDAECDASGVAHWYISDRSGLDPIVYTALFVSDTAVREMIGSPQWKCLEQKMRAGTVLLCEAGGPWLTNDGVRWMPREDGEWIEHDKKFRTMLQSLDIPFTLVSKDVLDVEERVGIALKAHGQLLNGSKNDAEVVLRPE